MLNEEKSNQVVGLLTDQNSQNEIKAILKEREERNKSLKAFAVDPQVVFFGCGFLSKWNRPGKNLLLI